MPPAVEPLVALLRAWAWVVVLERAGWVLVPGGGNVSPLYAGPMWAWTCQRCGRVWHMRAGVLPPPTGCGNAFAGCAGREAPVERVVALDYEAREGSMRIEYVPPQETVAEALAAASNMWRAHAEALAEALDGLITVVSVRDSLYASEKGWISTARAALARLPAQAVAARRALEACAYVLTLWNRLAEHKTPPIEATKAALAALDATRQEGRA